MTENVKSSDPTKSSHYGSPLAVAQTVGSSVSEGVAHSSQSDCFNIESPNSYDTNADFKEQIACSRPIKL